MSNQPASGPMLKVRTSAGLILIPNLVNTVKGYADFEQETLTAVIEARAKATQVTVDPSKISPEKLAEFQNAHKAS
jgi:hypothetical protein